MRMDWTALHAACAWGSLESVQLLVDFRADPSLYCRYSRYETMVDINDGSMPAKVTDGPSAIHLACARGHLTVVAFLHETAGIDIDYPGSMYGFSLVGAHGLPTPKAYPPSPYDDDLDVTEWPTAFMSFPDSYSIRDMDCHDRASEFPVHWHVNICKLYGGTPLLLACVRGYSDVIQYLLNAGADVDACGVDGSTPLSVLREFEHVEASELLLSAAAGTQSEKKRGRLQSS